MSPENADRASYRTWLSIPTRWADNDVYGHVNNVEYLAFFDTVVNHHLVTTGALDVQHGPVIGLCVESHCTYHASLAFPDVIQAGLRVGKLGRTSARYEIGLFRGEDPDPAANGYFVHVFVDRETRRPVAIPPALRSVLEAVSVED